MALSNSGVTCLRRTRRSFFRLDTSEELGHFAYCMKGLNLVGLERLGISVHHSTLSI